jgi:STE24 endopeptidase
MEYVVQFVLLCTIFTAIASAQSAGGNPAPTPPVADRHATSESFDVNAAVHAYLAKMPPLERARSNAYFGGGYWLLLWDFLSTVVVMWILLRFRWSMRMRDLTEPITHFRSLQTALYWVQFIIVVFVLTFPLTVYEGYFREHKYGLLNQTFGPWMRDQAVMLAVSVVLGGILMVPSSGWCGAREKAGGCGEP